MGLGNIVKSSFIWGAVIFGSWYSGRVYERANRQIEFVRKLPEFKDRYGELVTSIPISKLESRFNGNGYTFSGDYLGERYIVDINTDDGDESVDVHVVSD